MKAPATACTCEWRWQRVFANDLARIAGIRSAQRDDWSFYDGGLLVVLCLWSDSITTDGKTAVAAINARQMAAQDGWPLDWAEEAKHLRARARRYELTLQTAEILEHPIVAVLARGSTPQGAGALFEPWYPQLRMLDCRLWRVAAYDLDSGDALLRRTTEKFGVAACAEPEASNAMDCERSGGGCAKPRQVAP